MLQMICPGMISVEENGCISERAFNKNTLLIISYRFDLLADKSADRGQMIFIQNFISVTVLYIITRVT